MDVLGHGSDLVWRFEEFYHELLRLERQVEHGAWAFAEREAEPGEESEEETAGPETAGPVAVWQSLLTLLERQAASVRRPSADPAAGVHLEAQYAMAALADEIFLHLDWGGSEAWSSNLLEAKLFRSHRAGEVIFERIDALLASNDAARSDLAQVYLMTLGLGFQGRYRNRQGGDAELDSYRRRLFGFITRRDPALLSGERRLFPRAYASTLDQAGQERLPYLRPWLLALGLLLTLWVAASFPIWHWLTADLEQLLAKFLQG